MLHIKVKGINSLTDARYCAGMGVEKLEIVFDKNGQSALSLSEWNSIRAWIEGVDWVGEYTGTETGILKQLAIDTGILEWTISPELYQKVHLENPSLTFTIKSENLLEGPGVSGNERFSLPASGVDGLQIWIHAPENPSALLEMHAAYPDFGFVLQSGTEERPGWRDLSNLQDVLEKLEETD
jgi:phosphoribosylanthranilate isomerase